MQSSKKRALLNKCIAAGITAVIMLLIAALFDYYFDLNDDVFMKNILSGSYTGIPEDHNIQMLYPISALISLVYRLFRGVDVYGIFLCACQFACIYLVLGRVITACDSIKSKVIGIIVLVIMATGCLLGHLVYVQYTFTVAMLAATAAFLVMTGDGRNNRIGGCVIIWLSFLIRSEMLLLMLPMAGMAWLYRFVSDAQRKDVRKVYIRWAAILFAGLILCKGADKVAYSGSDWSEFVDFFDARTELYDYQSIPFYEGNEEFYESIGLDESEVELFFNYNYGLDEKIDAQIMDQVASYAKSIKEETPMVVRIKNALYLYTYRLRHFGLQKEYQYPMTDAPWNLIILVLYLGVAVEALAVLLAGKNAKNENKANETKDIENNEKENIEKEIKDSKRKEAIYVLGFLILLFIVRSLLWMYIIVGERDPIRITHGLMIMEISVLGGVLFERAKTFGIGSGHKDASRKAYLLVMASLLVVTSFAYIPNTVSIVKSEYSNRQEYNQKFSELYDYIKADPDNFYWIDVYTSVSYTSEAYTSYSYSEKMFEGVSNYLDNYDIPGGWACKSPLQTRKLESYGFTDIQSSLLKDNVYFVITDESSTDFLVAYYNNKGIKITLEEVDVVADKFRIMKLFED